MSFNNIVAMVHSLSKEPNKLSENEEAKLYIYLADKGDSGLADVEKLLYLCETSNDELVYLKGLLKKPISDHPINTVGTSEFVYVFIENSNTFMKEADERQVQFDYGKLVKTVLNGRPMGADPVIVGSRPLPNDTLWAKLESDGFNVTIKDRKFKGNEVVIEMLIYIMNTIHVHNIPGTMILIARDGDYGPAIKRTLKKGWINEIWLWSKGLSESIKEIDVNNSELNELRTTIVHLGDYYKFALRHNNNVGTRFIEIFTDIVDQKNRINFLTILDLYDWWYRPNRDTLKLYVSNFQQWRELKNLLMDKYPQAREINKNAFYLEEITFLKTYLPFLNKRPILPE
ncbi:1352_t:CDS:2 [Funneliformis geosporum]|uniref:1352_t:CDS:1 n=1 Tax=Funneliformis geosporum TaxID=1117311 RepID=A0A9W4SV19_9GLOM|nr:1352_t:CDS:2 [Funneliformis geosporum]